MRHFWPGDPKLLLLQDTCETAILVTPGNPTLAGWESFELATLTVDGRDVAGVMVGEGLARPYHGKRWQGWCDR
jgi:hypothetical protein